MMTNGRISSSSSSSDEESFVIPSVKNLASKYNSLSEEVKSVKEVTLKSRSQSAPAEKPTAKKSVTTNSKLMRKCPVQETGRKKPEVVQLQKKPERQYSSSSDEVFESNDSGEKNVSSELVPAITHVKKPSDAHASSVSDGSVTNVLFGVKLRRVDKTVWGVMQKRTLSLKNSSDLESSSVGNQVSPSSPFSEDSVNKFASLPITVGADEKPEQPSSNTLVRKTGAVEGKIARQKLGNKLSSQYHSLSDLSERISTSPGERRKSVSEDNMKMHPPLTRMTSINHLLKLYRTKSQSDLTQTDNDSRGMHFTAVKKGSAEGNPVKSPPTAPLTMNDVKICLPLSNAPVAYKSEVKDIVRLRNPVTIKPHVVPAPTKQSKDSLLRSTSSKSVDEDDKTFASVKNEKLQTNAIPSDSNSKRLTALLTPHPYSKTDGTNKKVLDIFEEVRQERERAARHMSNKDANEIPTEKQPQIQEKPKDEIQERVTKQTYTKNTNAESSGKNRKTFKVHPLRKTNSITSLIDALNQNEGFANKNGSSSSSGSSDELDAVPHDEKGPSFIVTQPASLPSSINKTNKTEKEDKLGTKIPVVKYSQKSKFPLKKISVSNDEPELLNDHQTNHFVSKTTGSTGNKPDSLQNVNGSSNSNAADIHPKQVYNSFKGKGIRADQQSSSDQSDSNDLPDSKRTGHSNANEKNTAPSNLKLKVTRDIPKNRFAGTTSESSQDESTSPKYSVQQNSLGKTPKPTARKNTATVSVVQLEGEAPDQYINYRSGQTSNGLKGKSGSSQGEGSKNNSKIVRETTKYRSSSSEDDLPTPKLRSFKENQKKYAVASSSSPSKKLETQPNKRSSDEESSEGANDRLTEFDPYAIGRMIVRGARKRDSHVKRHENTTPIFNASVPRNSPFSPVSFTTSERKKNLGLSATPQKSSKSSSSSDEDSLSYFDTEEYNGQDGVYSANLAMVK